MNEKRIEPRIEVVYDYKKEAAKNGMGTVWVRCYFTRTQRKYISTGVRVAPGEWSARWWVIGRPDAAALNIRIKEQYNECMRMAAQVVQNFITVPSGRQMKAERSPSSFLDFMQDQIEKENISKGTKAHHLSTLNLLLIYGKMRRFEQVTSEAVSEWMAWLSRRNIRQITVHDHWKRLRKYIRIAQRKGKIPFNAVSGVSVKRGEAREREHLTVEEIERWIGTPMPLPYLEATRDRFIVQTHRSACLFPVTESFARNSQHIPGLHLVEFCCVKFASFNRFHIFNFFLFRKRGGFRTFAVKESE